MLQEIVGAVPVSQLKRGGNSHARPHDFTRKERKVFKMCKPTTTITAKVEELMELRKNFKTRWKLSPMKSKPIWAMKKP